MRKQLNWKDDIKRITTLFLGKGQQKRIICVTSLSENRNQRTIVNVLVEAIEERNKKVCLINVEEVDVSGEIVEKLEKDLCELKEKFDYIVICDLSISHYAEGVAIAALSDETILIIEKGTVNGDKAIELKRELDLNGAHVLGAIFVK